MGTLHDLKMQRNRVLLEYPNLDSLLAGPTKPGLASRGNSLNDKRPPRMNANEEEGSFTLRQINAQQRAMRGGHKSTATQSRQNFCGEKSPFRRRLFCRKNFSRISIKNCNTRCRSPRWSSWYPRNSLANRSRVRISARVIFFLTFVPGSGTLWLKSFVSNAKLYFGVDEG